MHDIKMIREIREQFDSILSRRGVEPVSVQIITLDTSLRVVATHVQELQGRRNEISKLVGTAIKAGKLAEAESFKAEIVSIKQNLAEFEAEQIDLEERRHAELASLPNLPDPDVPDGIDESQNLEISRWGTPRTFNFTPREHADLGPSLGLDFETGALISGARFTFLRGQMARLQRALGQFMLDMQTATNGHTECATPLLVRDEAMFGTGQLPKFGEDSFETDISLDPFDYGFFKRDALKNAIDAGRYSTEADLTSPDVWHELPDPPTRRWLIPTAEVSLTNSVREQILDNAALPIRLTALTPCFRSEAGAAGKDTRGYIRQHQFEKVELVTICKPEDSVAEHERMVKCAESILEALELPYRKLLLCAGDMGFTARKTFDLEVWLPGQNAYREISSISNCGDFQARRMNTRFRPAKEDGKPQKGTEFVHTLNGSGLAVGRTLVAVLENGQQEDGSVDLPAALLPYMGGIDRLVPA